MQRNLKTFRVCGGMHALKSGLDIHPGINRIKLLRAKNKPKNTKKRATPRKRTRFRFRETSNHIKVSDPGTLKHTMYTMYPRYLDM